MLVKLCIISEHLFFVCVYICGIYRVKVLFIQFTKKLNYRIMIGFVVMDKNTRSRP